MKIGTYLFQLPATLLICLLLTEPSTAQLERERALPDAPVDHIFWATSNVGLNTVLGMPSGNLNSTVLHTFGLVDGGIDRFFGLDDGANTRIGIEAGIHDRFDLGLGRMTFNNIVDLRGKWNLIRQKRDDSRPLDLALSFSLLTNTQSGMGFDFGDRLAWHSSVMIARKINGLTLQLSPMIAWYNAPEAHFFPASADTPDRLIGLGIIAFYELNDRFALSGEYLPVLGDRNPGSEDTMGWALHIDTGGHTFQIFLTSSQWHNEAHMMANNRHNFLEGEFRFGFNIHRVFGLR